jgi:23S rRNA pseudouridine1911/1915/1917 synthase
MKKQEIIITEELAGMRIDSVAAKVFPEFSRSQWQKNGEFREKSGKRNSAKKTKVSLGEIWTVRIKQSPTNKLDKAVAWDFPLEILAESDSWAAIYKPLGISIHPSQSAPEPKTIVNALVHHFGKNLAENSDGLDGQEIEKPGIVHRLDKTTSGVLLVAKTNKTHAFLQKNWKEVEKTYIALAENRGEKFPKSGKITAGITRDPRNRQRMTVSNEDSAKSALTLFEKIDENKKFTLLKVNIPTGRTHQIRVHLSAIGHPIHGDVKYGGKEAERVMLHAEKIIFPDPDKNGEMTEVVAPLPAEFSLE